jgi:hypothetical protein
VWGRGGREQWGDDDFGAGRERRLEADRGDLDAAWNVARRPVPCRGRARGGVDGGGAGGDITAPAGVYNELATGLQVGGAEGLCLGHRTPNQLDECVYDLLAGIEALGQRGGERVVLVGRSFGGAVVISAGAANDAVVGAATAASQSYGAEAVEELSLEKSLLLIHGTSDWVLPTSSRNAYTPRRASRRS